MKNIALIGWNGKNNFGDTLMQSLLNQELSKFGFVTEYSDIESNKIIKTDHSLEFLKNDYIFFGGGNIISSDFWPFHQLEKIKNKKIGLINVNLTKSIFDNESLLLNLKKLDSMWAVRDSYTSDILSQYNIESTLIPDISIKNTNYIKKNNKKCLFFLNQNYFDFLFNENKEDYIKALYFSNILSNHIDWLKYFDWSITFIPSQITNEIDDRIPGCLINRQCKTFKDNTWITESLSSDDIITLIKDSELVFSMRLHPALVSLSYNIPTVVLSFHDKFKNIFKDMDLLNILIDVNDVNSASLIQVNQLAESINIKEKINKYLLKNSFTYHSFLKGFFN